VRLLSVSVSLYVLYSSRGGVRSVDEQL
jgi:hypothetical protein